jgi:acyl-CoA reductase-like NAD-dependent aldehyde dehydrogenase
MLRFILGQIHVMTSDRNAIREIISRLRNGKATWKAMPRRQRHDTIREILRIHRANRKLYVDVMCGRIG